MWWGEHSVRAACLRKSANNLLVRTVHNAVAEAGIAGVDDMQVNNAIKKRHPGLAEKLAAATSADEAKKIVENLKAEILSVASKQSICDTVKAKLNDFIQEAFAKEMGVEWKHGDKELVKTVLPRRADDGVYRTGAWVRDSSAGIGTVTYYDEQNGCFAALGHGVCDRDTGALLPLGSAEVVSAEIGSVTKSSTGKAGSLNGVFCDTEIGDLTKNTVCGVFGTTNDNFPQNGAELEIADNEEIELGKALIYTTVDGAEPCCYEAEITRLCDLDSQTNENFVIKVTDDRLIRDCGGIVQGMSGSPVVQNNKLVGAVTHVFLNSPHEGYGVTAQNMVSNYQK